MTRQPRLPEPLSPQVETWVNSIAAVPAFLVWLWFAGDFALSTFNSLEPPRWIERGELNRMLTTLRLFVSVPWGFFWACMPAGMTFLPVQWLLSFFARRISDLR